MDNRNVVTKARIFISDEEESEVMAEPSYDEIMAAQGLLEFSREIRRFYDNIVSVFTLIIIKYTNIWSLIFVLSITNYHYFYLEFNKYSWSCQSFSANSSQSRQILKLPTLAYIHTNGDPEGRSD